MFNPTAAVHNSSFLSSVHLSVPCKWSVISGWSQRRNQNFQLFAFLIWSLISLCIDVGFLPSPSHSYRLSLFFSSHLFIYYLVIYFSVLNISTVLLLVSVQNVKINSSKHTSRSSSSHLLESCISFSCLCFFLCPVSFPCKSNQFYHF